MQQGIREAGQSPARLVGAGEGTPPLAIAPQRGVLLPLLRK